MSSAEAVILKYLTTSNRPYSVGDIHNNLQKVEGLGKTVVSRAVDNLVTQNKIKEKAYGKQKIYFIDQDTLASMSSDDVKKLDDEIKQLTMELASINASLKPMETKMNDIKKGMSLDEILSHTKELEAENQQLSTKLKSLKEKMKNVEPNDNDKVKEERTKLVQEWRKRKRMSSSILECILDGYPHPKKQLLEEVGLETDEDAGVSIFALD